MINNCFDIASKTAMYSKGKRTPKFAKGRIVGQTSSLNYQSASSNGVVQNAKLLTPLHAWSDFRVIAGFGEGSPDFSMGQPQNNITL